MSASPPSALPPALLRTHLSVPPAPDGDRSRHPDALPVEQIANAPTNHPTHPPAAPAASSTPTPAARLHHAVKVGNLDAVYDLLQAGVDPDSRHEGSDPPILIASRSNEPKLNDMVELFVKGGADVNVACPNDGSTPLMHAVRRTQVGLVNTLLGRPDIRIHKEDKAGVSAYMLASSLARGPFTEKIFDLIKRRDQAHPQR